MGSIGRRLERQFGRIYHVAVEAIRCALKVSVGFDDVIFPIQGILKVDSMLESAVYHIPTLSIFGGHGEIENIAKDDGAPQGRRRAKLRLPRYDLHFCRSGDGGVCAGNQGGRGGMG